MAMYEDIETEL